MLAGDSVLVLTALASIALSIVAAGQTFAGDAPSAGDAAAIRYQAISVSGVNIFYREAGPAGAPVVLLLHGFPTSSFMFRNLIPQLADRYHVIAPDYPGFGLSDAPDPKIWPTSSISSRAV